MSLEHAHPVILGDCVLSSDATIDPFCVIGYVGDEADVKEHQKGLTTEIGAHVRIGPFATIYAGARLHENVKLDPYVRIGRNTDVGAGTAVLYGSRVHDDVQIGTGCIIAGNVSNRVKIGSRVMHHGRLAHRYNRPHAEWHQTDEPSMVIEDDVVVGAGSILVGDIRIGEKSYIAAGEIVREDVPPFSVYYKGRAVPAKDWRGTLSVAGFWGTPLGQDR